MASLEDSIGMKAVFHVVYVNSISVTAQRKYFERYHTHVNYWT